MFALPGNFLQALPGIELSHIINVLSLLMLSSIRIGSFLISSPLLGYRIIPVQVRIIASFSISVIIIFQVEIPDVISLAGIQLFIIIAIEILIGLIAGTILTIIFSSATLAGEKMAGTAGLSFAGLIDPESGAQTPVLGQIMNLLMLITFLSLNGHLIAISTMLNSYKVLPIGTTTLSLEVLRNGIEAGGLMFKFGALIMLPVVIGITLVNVLIGIVTRSAPTLNLFSFGFPITMIISFILLYLTAEPIGNNIRSVTETGLDMILKLVEGLI